MKRADVEREKNRVWFGQVDFKDYLLSDVQEYLEEWIQASGVKFGLKIYDIVCLSYINSLNAQI